MLIAKHLPKGPKGQKRPADVISNAVHVMKIATSEIDESAPPDESKNKAASNCVVISDHEDRMASCSVCTSTKSRSLILGAVMP
jgi:hypothetical protein